MRLSRDFTHHLVHPRVSSSKQWIPYLWLVFVEIQGFMISIISGRIALRHMICDMKYSPLFDMWSEIDFTTGYVIWEQEIHRQACKFICLIYDISKDPRQTLRMNSWNRWSFVPQFCDPPWHFGLRVSVLCALLGAGNAIASLGRLSAEPIYSETLFGSTSVVRDSQLSLRLCG
jgi:hypothetical protein